MKPADDEIEVSFFGPGYGESVVLHIGHDEWVVVDSCRDPATAACIPLRYLEQLGVDTARQVKLIVATHWHDDHMAGLADLYRNSLDAVIAFPAAVQDADFKAFVWIQNEIPSKWSGVRELYDILHHRESEDRTERRIRYAKAETPLLKRDDDIPVTITALSPTDESMHRALQTVANLLPQDEQRQLRVRSPKRNDASVVLWVDIDGLPMLFGADLEEEHVRNWTDVLDSTTRPTGTADVFKVPHHGSKNAHHGRVWEEMLSDYVLPVTCPWQLAGSFLPTDEDVERICSLATPMYLTARRQLATAPHRSNPVRKTLRETGLRPTPTQPAPGHVRLRRSCNDTEWEVELFSGAQRVPSA